MSDQLYKPRPALSRRWFSFRLRTMLVVVAAAAVGALWLSRYLESLRSIDWQPFSQNAVRQVNARGRSVLVSFWADWTMSVALPERMIDTPAVRRLLRGKGVVPMRADWSQPQNSPGIIKELKALGRKSIPLFVIYPASGKKPIILGDANGIVSAESLAEALRNLKD